MMPVLAIVGGMNFQGFDPSQMDPKALMEISQLVQQLPGHQLNRMQSLMHNMMAGFDVSKEMEEFEKTLPPGFKEKLTGLMGASAFQTAAATTGGAAPAIEVPAASSSEPMDVKSARLTILRAVASGSVSPEEAEGLLFSGS
jgi:hypothetical protein